MRILKVLFILFLLIPVSNVKAQNSGELSPRAGHKMVYDSKNNRVILFGGNTFGQKNEYYDDTWVFSTADNTWTQLTIDGPSSRGEHSMAYNPDKESILLFGGQTSAGRIGDTWIFDCRTEKWTEIETETSPEGRSDFDMIYDPSRKIFILYGGYGRYGLKSDSWMFDPETNTWSEYETYSNPGRMYGQSLEYDSFGERVILYGGHLRSPTSRDYVDEVWFFSPDNGSWIQSSGLNKPHGRYWGAVGYSPEHSSLAVFGGTYGEGQLNETWVFNIEDTSWTELDSPVFPSRRVISDMVYVESELCFILFGGVNTSYIHFSDTWKLDAETWTWSQIQTRYSAREATGNVKPNNIPGYSMIPLLIGVGSLIILTRKRSLRKLCR